MAAGSDFMSSRMQFLQSRKQKGSRFAIAQQDPLGFQLVFSRSARQPYVLAFVAASFRAGRASTVIGFLQFSLSLGHGGGFRRLGRGCDFSKRGRLSATAHPEKPENVGTLQNHLL